ncbi:MAG: lysophospholipid acyltransferase family protein [Thermoanaerobaculia bacterium]
MSRLRGFRDGLLAALLRGLSLLLQPLGWRGAQRFGGGLGLLGWWLGRRDRRRTLEHLALAFPELSSRQCRRLGRASFRHHGTTLGECLFLLRRDCGAVTRVVAVDGWDHVESVRRAGRSVLILTGHCGNWELLAALINCRGLGMRVVARRLDAEGFQRLLLGLRERFGTESIERGESGAARSLLRTLRDGGALGILIDQDTRVDGVWVPFFGRPAYTPVAAAQLARRHGAGVIPAFIERRSDGRHLARFHPPIELPADPEAATAILTRVIEDQIRRVPEQWVWMHRRWRRQPP